MKKFLISALFSAILLSVVILFASCGFFSLSDDNDYPANDNYEDNDDVADDNLQDQAFTVTTTSETDDYGLAGTYTMLNNKEYAVGDKVELTAEVNNGYNFDGWYIEEKTGTGYYVQTNYILLSENTSYSYTMQSKSVKIVARFSAFTVTTTSTGNTGGAAGTYTILNAKKTSNGEKVSLAATVNDGYNFEGWYVGDVCVSKNLTYDYTMEKKNISFEAKYSSYQLSTIGTAKNSAGKAESGFNAGTYTQYSNENISQGKSVKLVATVNDGYNFVGWYINGICVSNQLEYTHVMGKEDVKITALYSYYTLSTTVEYGSLGPGYTTTNLSSSAGQYISPVYEKQKISVNTEISLTANEITGWKFIAWMRSDGGVLSYDRTVTFKMQAGDLRVYALYYNEAYV